MATDGIHHWQGPGFGITVVGSPDPGQVCVQLKGALDIAALSIAKERIEELKRRDRHLVLDLRGLSFIDSTGLHFLLKLAAEATRDGWELSLLPGSSVVQRIFQLTGTEERLPFRGPLTDGEHPAPDE
jgi:anti-anti-sigma factor